jgi:hypothetical protein
MKPAWDSLMKKYEGSATGVVADVDCTAEGKELCSEIGVKGYPTIKYGDPSALEDYKGGRTLADLEKFAEENLKPTCSPANIDLCDDEKKAKITEISAMPADELATKIADAQKAIKDAEENYTSEVEKLQATYKKLTSDKEETIKALKDSGLGLMVAVQAHLKKASKDEL